MKVTGKDETFNKYINETLLTQTEKPLKKAPAPADVPPKSPRELTVSVSQRAMEVVKAYEAMESEPDVRLDKVQAIKKKIENGTYEIDYDKTAEKMLRVFSDEII